jgi:rhodanese-related sulfurtransferase
MKNIFGKIRNRFRSNIAENIDYKTMVKLARENKTVIIDVRTKDEYYNRHIDGAINIPLQDISLKIESIVKNKNEIIIVYCEHGGRSKKACNKLKKMGYKNVFNLINGIEGI